VNAVHDLRPQEHLVTDKGELRILFLRRDLVVQRAAGTGSIEIAQRITQTLGAAMRRGERLHIFDDFSALDDYTSAARIELTAWTRAHLASIQSIHILTRSKLVAMGASVANDAYTSSGPFELARERVRANPLAPRV